MVPSSEERERSPKRRHRSPDSGDESPERRRRRRDSPERDGGRREERSRRDYDRERDAPPRSRSRSRSRSRERAAARSDRPHGGGERRDRASPPQQQPPQQEGVRGRGRSRFDDGAGARNGGGAARHENGGGGAPAEPPERKPAAAATTTKAGGVYIPPFKLARLMAEVEDKASPEAQRLTWDALRKSINGIINKVNAPNLRLLLPELLQENLVRGRGLFCQSLMKAQMASPSFSPVYAALVAVVNTKFPELGELLLHRLIAQLKRAYKRNDKAVTVAATKFLAHLINQGVLHELLALELLILLLEAPSDDSVEVAVDFLKDVGAHLQDVAPAGLHSVFERLRAVLHEGEIDKRTQYLIEGLFALRKAGFEKSGHAAVAPALDLVEDGDQICHEMGLDERHDPQAALNVFRVDPEFLAHEAQYQAIVRELLGGGGGSDDDDGEGGDDDEGGSGSEEEESDEDDEGGGGGAPRGGGGGGGGGGQQRQQRIDDLTETDLVNLRRTIYLTIMSSLDFEEAGHKLMRIALRPGQEAEIPIMIIECCSQERTYVRYYGLLAARFCAMRREYQAAFEDAFARQYALIHRLETNKLRNVAKLFAHLLAADGVSWGVLGAVRLTEEETTSSSRIFVKYLFQELSETLGLAALNKRLAEPSLQPYFGGLFPDDSAANMRFAINFFTSIGLGGITDRMREAYKELPKLLAARRAAEQEAAARAAAERRAARGGASSSDGDDSSSSDSGSSSSSSGTSSSGSDDSSSSDSGTSSGSDSESDDSRRRRARRDDSRDRDRGGRRRDDDSRERRRRRSSSREPPRRRDGDDSRERRR